MTGSFYVIIGKVHLKESQMEMISVLEAEGALFEQSTSRSKGEAEGSTLSFHSSIILCTGMSFHHSDVILSFRFHSIILMSFKSFNCHSNVIPAIPLSFHPYDVILHHSNLIPWIIFEQSTPRSKGEAEGSTLRLPNISFKHHSWQLNVIPSFWCYSIIQISFHNSDVIQVIPLLFRPFHCHSIIQISFHHSDVIQVIPLSF